MRPMNMPGRLLLAVLCCCMAAEARGAAPAGGITCQADPYPSELVQKSGLYELPDDPAARTSLIRFKTRDGHTLNAYTYRATGFSGSDGPIVFILHGAARNAIDYLNRFKPIAERHGALAIAPEFPDTIYGPGSDRYTLAVSRGKPIYSGTYMPWLWRPPDRYLYSEIEHLFEAVRQELGSSRCTYGIWGHSAGGQFVHRLVTFRPDARVDSAVAVNSGFYTLPSYGNGSDPNYSMPYGLKGTPLKEEDVRRLLEAPLVVLVGEHDTETGEESESVRDSKYANFQGLNRRERAEFYFKTGKREALRLGLRFGWRFAVIPGAGHNARRVGPSAAWYLFQPPAAQPCVPTPAGQARGLVINEIYGDPAGGPSGDANRDGRRDPQGDEFVELVNTSDRDICLSGWHLTDAASPERHRFPIGSLLPAGKALVVFGGGIPTGAFGEAEVQTAFSSGELNLNNEGDVLTLADADGKAYQRISWGDCAGQQCAEEHIASPINIDQSLNRWPETKGPFTPHGSLQHGKRYSPGMKTDGTFFR